ncbi:hypothetical protein AGABI1DRAFT_96208, partial [Agaricus bisporus var. burnettii JB137-S8]
LEVELTTEGLLQGLRHSTDYVSQEHSSQQNKVPDPVPPPVPFHSKPGASSRSAEAKNNARAFAARVVPKSYAQAAKASAAPTAPAPIIMNETIQWAKALKDQCPEMSFQDALKAVAPMVNTPPSSNEVIVLLNPAATDSGEGDHALTWLDA